MTFGGDWVQKLERLNVVIWNTNLPIVRSFHIRPDSEVVRTPAPSYASDGRRTNKGLRLDKDGSLVKTRDEFGNQIPGTHNTGEKVSN